MRKIALVLLVLCVALGTAYAQSSKAAVNARNVNILSASTLNATSDNPWTPILRTTIKTSQQKDLFMGVSLECGLYTETTVSSKNMTSDTSTAGATVEVRVSVDGRTGAMWAVPEVANFCKRTQTLTATLEGAIASCLSVDSTTGGIVLDPNCVQPESIGLILDTMNANHFNFVLPDVGVGIHNVEVQARLGWNTSVQTGSAKAKAAIGNGVITVEEVRLVKDTDVTAF